MSLVAFYKLATTKKIMTQEDLVNELQNLLESYLRLKEQLLVRIYIQTPLGKEEIRDFRRFALLALCRNRNFTLERDVDFIFDNENYGKKLVYSTKRLRKLINPRLDRRGITEEFCAKITEEIRSADELSELFP